MKNYLVLYRDSRLYFLIDSSRPWQSLALLRFMSEHGINTVQISKSSCVQHENDLVVHFPHAIRETYHICLESLRQYEQTVSN